MTNGSRQAPHDRRRPGRKAYLLITLFALLMVLFPFLFWYYTWFGRKLSDRDLDQYFADKSKPRHAQHALVQVGERLAHRQNVSHWYPDVIEQASSPNLELRETAAWIMGQDRTYAPFHEALLRLLHDPQPLVRRNAALSLALFGDAAGRPELVAMLRPFTIRATAGGKLKYRLKLGDYVNPGTLIGRAAGTGHPRHVHFLGICGYAVSGAAILAQQMGDRVTGSDDHAYPPVSDIVTAAGIQWENGHDPRNLDRFGGSPTWWSWAIRCAPSTRSGWRPSVGGYRSAARSSSSSRSPARGSASRSAAPTARRPPRPCSSTCSRAAGSTPASGSARPPSMSAGAPGSAPVRSSSRATSTPPRPGTRAQFLHMRPEAACVTRLEWDHPDVYPSPEAYRMPFVQLAETMPAAGLLVLCGDDPAALELRAHA